jgi:phosphoribosylformylglycinamidine synthase
VARVAVDVVIKPEILDPQGKAILSALARTGQPGVSAVRQGKHFDLEVDDSVSDADLEEIAGTLLANPVIETWTVTRMAPETVRSVDTAGTFDTAGIFDTAGTVRDTR